MSTRRTRRAVAVLGATAATVLLTSSVGVSASHLDDPFVETEPVDDPIPGHIADGAIQLELQTVSQGLVAPNWGTSVPEVPGVLFVSDQPGPLWAVDLATGRKNVLLDTSSLLVPLILDADERGFLGVAFHPDYATNGLVYTMTSEPIEPIDPENPPTPADQPNHWATVREWTVPDPTDDLLDREPLTPEASRIVYRALEPQFNHNGGALFFGVDGVPGDPHPGDGDLLYITLGDGGCADDQHGQLGLAGEGHCISHEGEGNAQRLDNPHGKILRLDPTAVHELEFTEPDPQVPVLTEPEIFAFGFRNPFRASVDRATGEIWTADVGQNHLEEVDGPVVQGGNYGWRVKEGTWLFNPDEFALMGFASDGFVWAPSPGAPAGLIDPVAEYDHDEGVATIGGFVYRGRDLTQLQGTYVFGDYSDGFHSANGRVMYVDPGDVADPHDRTPMVFNLVNGHINLFVLGFGEDAAGELYVLANETGGPDGDSGVVMRLVEECVGDAECRD